MSCYCRKVCSCLDALTGHWPWHRLRARGVRCVEGKQCFQTCRLGASLALKQCAEALAKEADLADTYMLQALQHVVLALRTAEADPAGTGTRQQAAEAMQVSWTCSFPEHP